MNPCNLDWKTWRRCVGYAVVMVVCGWWGFVIIYFTVNLGKIGG